MGRPEPIRCTRQCGRKETSECVAHTVYNNQGVVAGGRASMEESRTVIPWEAQQALEGVICIVHHHRRELVTLPQQRPGALSLPERALASHDHLHMDFIRPLAFFSVLGWVFPANESFLKHFSLVFVPAGGT